MQRFYRIQPKKRITPYRCCYTNSSKAMTIDEEITISIAGSKDIIGYSMRSLDGITSSVLRVGKKVSRGCKGVLNNG